MKLIKTIVASGLFLSSGSLAATLSSSTEVPASKSYTAEVAYDCTSSSMVDEPGIILAIDERQAAIKYVEQKDYLWFSNKNGKIVLNNEDMEGAELTVTCSRIKSL